MLYIIRDEIRLSADKIKILFRPEERNVYDKVFAFVFVFNAFAFRVGFYKRLRQTRPRLYARNRHGRF